MNNVAAREMVGIDFLPYATHNDLYMVNLPQSLFDAAKKKTAKVVFVPTGTFNVVHIADAITALISQCRSVAVVQNLNHVLCLIDAGAYQRIEDFYLDQDFGARLVAVKDATWRFLPAPESIEAPLGCKRYELKRTLELIAA